MLTGPTTTLTQNLNLVLNTGTLTLSGTGALVTTGTTAVTLNLAGGLTLDNSGTSQIPTTTSLNARLAANTTLTFNGGTFTFNGSNAVNATTTQTLGNVTLNSGQSTIISSKGTGATDISALTFGTFTRTTGAGATATFQAGATGTQTFDTSTNVVNFSSFVSGGPSNGVLPGVGVIDGSTISNSVDTPVVGGFKYGTTSPSAPARPWPWSPRRFTPRCRSPAATWRRTTCWSRAARC